MKLSRRQMIALRLLDAAIYDVEWPAINAAVRMFGERGVNGCVIGMSLVRKKLAITTQSRPACFAITDKGRDVAENIVMFAQISTKEDVRPVPSKRVPATTT